MTTPVSPMDETPRVDAPVRRQCTATSKQSGERCKRLPIPGGTVCVMHGGATSASKNAARRRLAALVDPAIDTLSQEMRDAAKSNDRQAAANSILDRAGYGRVSKIDAGDAREMLISRLIEMRGAERDD